MGMLDAQRLAGPWLKDEAADAVTASLLVMGGSYLLVGTRSGVLLSLRLTSTTASAELQAELVYAQRIHCGALYDIALSTTQLVATAGHDAVCCVVPLADIVASPRSVSPPALALAPTAMSGARGRGIRRLSGHTLPVLALAFFADGGTVATLSLHGEVIIFDVASGGLRCRLHCGFPARALALSADETCCFVAGSMLARVDLFYAMRTARASEGSSLPYHAATNEVSESPQPWMRLCCWSTDEPHDGARGDWDRRVYVTAAGMVIDRLHMSKEDGSLTALFVRRERGDGPAAATTTAVGVAQWSFTSAQHPFLADSFTTAAAANHAAAVGSSPHRSWRASRSFTPSGSQPVAQHHAATPMVGAFGAVGAPSWRDAACVVRTARRRALCDVTPDTEKGLGEYQPMSKAQRLEEARLRHDILQSECNELARQLREAMAR